MKVLVTWGLTFSRAWVDMDAASGVRYDAGIAQAIATSAIKDKLPAVAVLAAECSWRQRRQAGHLGDHCIACSRPARTRVCSGQCRIRQQGLDGSAEH